MGKVRRTSSKSYKNLHKIIEDIRWGGEATIIRSNIRNLHIRLRKLKYSKLFSTKVKNLITKGQKQSLESIMRGKGKTTISKGLEVNMRFGSTKQRRHWGEGAMRRKRESFSLEL